MFFNYILKFKYLAQTIEVIYFFIPKVDFNINAKIKKNFVLFVF